MLSPLFLSFYIFPLFESVSSGVRKLVFRGGGVPATPTHVAAGGGVMTPLSLQAGVLLTTYVLTAKLT